MWSSSVGSRVKSAPLGPKTPHHDEDSPQPAALPARGLQETTVFAVLELALTLDQVANQPSLTEGHDVKARVAEVAVDLEPVRRRIAEEVEHLHRVLAHRADFKVSVVLRLQSPPRTPWWAEFT